MILPKIISVTWDYLGDLIAGQSNNLVVKVQEEILEKALLLDNSKLQIIDKNGKQMFTKNIEDNYQSAFSGLDIDIFIQEVLGK